MMGPTKHMWQAMSDEMDKRSKFDTRSPTFAGKTLTVRALVLAEAARLGSGGGASRRHAAPPPALVYINCMSLGGNPLLTRVAEGLQRNMHRTPKQVGLSSVGGWATPPELIATCSST